MTKKKKKKKIFYSIKIVFLNFMSNFPLLQLGVTEI